MSVRTTEPSFQRRFLAVDRLSRPGARMLLVVPTPQGSQSDYAHLAVFLRTAPQDQRHALWQAVGRLVQANLSARPLWLSTAGGGVDWLHVRLDSSPKYYGYAPYSEHVAAP